MATFVKLVVGGALAAALYAGLGVGLGALIRNQVGAIIGALVCSSCSSGLVGVLILSAPRRDHAEVRAQRRPRRPDRGRWTAAIEPESLELLGQVPAGLVLAGYVAIFMVAGLVLMRRRDITA